jgi:hypothetical protein
MGNSGSNGKKRPWLSIISAAGAVLATAFSGYVSVYTSVLETNLEEKISREQVQTQKTIVALQESTKEKISELDFSTQKSIVALQESTKKNISELDSSTQKSIAEMQVATKEKISALESSFKRAELFTRSIKELKEPETSPLVLMGLWPLFSEDTERRVLIAAALHVGKPEVIDILMKLGKDELDPFLENVIQQAMNSNNKEVRIAATTFVVDRKTAMLDGLLRPVASQLARTEAAFKSYSGMTTPAEEQIILEANTRIRDLLRDRSDLIPADLKTDGDKLIEHYDQWFAEYQKQRGGKIQDEGPIYVGPKGYPFPVNSAKRFEEKFCNFASELRRWTDADLATIVIKQVPRELPEKSKSGRRLYELRFSVHVTSSSHNCLLDQIEEVVYIMDEKWWSRQNEFTVKDVTTNFEFVTNVWGTTEVKARIFLTNKDASLLRKGYMNLREIKFFKAETEEAPSQKD